MDKFKTKNILVIISHNLGGGTDYFIKSKIKLWSEQNFCIIINPSKEYEYFYEFKVFDWKACIYIFRTKLITFLISLKKIGNIKIIINHLYSYDELNLIELNDKFNIKYIYFHDYYTICPFIFLSPNDIFCGLPEANQCNICIKKNSSNESLTIETYREKYSILFHNNNIIKIVPTESVKQNLNKIYQNSEIIIKPNELINITPKVKINFSKSMQNIGILGELNFLKGISLVFKYINISEYKIRLIGKSNPHIIHKNFSEYGKYNNDLLTEIISNENISLFWFPVRIPETYSYTLTTAMRFNLPIFAPFLGSFKDRLINYEKASYFNYNDSDIEIFNKLDKTIKKYYN